MKKILMLCTIAFAVSCSSDLPDGGVTAAETDQVSNNQIMSVSSDEQPTIDDEIDQLFHDYVNSGEYVESDIAIKQFNAGLSNFSHFESFTSEDMMFSWIGSNISSTNFVNINEAREKWSRVKVTSTKLYNKFPGIWEFIESTTVVELSYRFDKWLPAYSYETRSGYCYSQLKSCRKAASDKYAEKAMVLAESYKSDEISGSERDYQRNNLKADFDSAMKVCLDTFNACD